MVRVNSVERV